MSAALKFQSAVRIAVSLKSVRVSDNGDGTGFQSAVRIAVSLKCSSSWCAACGGRFQSAVRIAVSLKLVLPDLTGRDLLVSIRRADRCLAEGRRERVAFRVQVGFNPPCGSLSR